MQNAKYYKAYLERLWLGQNGRHFASDIFKWIFLNENYCFLFEISLKYVPRGSLSNEPSTVQIIRTITWTNAKFTDVYVCFSAKLNDVIDLRTAQVYCDWIFLVSQEVYLNFHNFCV